MMLSCTCRQLVSAQAADLSAPASVTSAPSALASCPQEGPPCTARTSRARQTRQARAQHAVTGSFRRRTASSPQLRAALDILQPEGVSGAMLSTRVVPHAP